MSEEKKTPVKAEEGKGSKFANWIKNLPANIAKPFKNMVAELKKVTWPSKKKWISSSVMVLVFMLFMGVVIGLLDLGALGGIFGLALALAGKIFFVNGDGCTLDDRAAWILSLIHI